MELYNALLKTSENSNYQRIIGLLQFLKKAKRHLRTLLTVVHT